MGSGPVETRSDGQSANLVVGLVALGLVAVLVVLGVQLHATQAAARDDAKTRFRLRAEVTAALTQAVFSSAAESPETAKRYGSAVVSDRALDRAVRQGGLRYQALLNDEGQLIARSRAVSGASQAGLLSRSPSLLRALQSSPYALSDVVHSGPGGTPVIDFAVALKTPYGRRVLVGGLVPGAIGTFVSDYLRRIPAAVGKAYVIDGRGTVIGTSDPRPVVRQATQPGLLSSARHGHQGSFGQDGYFVAVPVASRWRVVLTVPASQLFGSVSGLRKWVPWLIFAALGLVGLCSLLLLRRMLAGRAALARANSELAESNAKLQGTNALLRHAAELARSNEELERFASIASHDLQEPLRKVQTFAAQLNVRERDRLSEQGQDFLRRMTAAAGRMRTLIDDLLMFSRVSTQGRPFVTVDLADVLDEVLLDVDHTGAQIITGDLPTIDADPVQMRQLLQNLLANALKFRRENVVCEIAIAARVVDGVADLTVTDNGIGFDPKYAVRIFRAFERLHGTSSYAGTGIGLALCYKIVERHHGTITADSRPGSGSVFRVRLPVQQHVSSAPQTPAPSATPAEMSFETVPPRV
ncbi:hypothetical protein FSW04_14025 [Baekduia soli]|uniref:Sensor-like histidine kinase SenX3 n=1 Tax=Baekduia soli TaxID=496014 RepID=A0A5B8U6G0_9ACTN|nr:ATP-binding protein [Baekduia soli]QEC48577.1 hypothetical protein FSW04_14025 [Baekduia soli]